jgi:phosphate starvation-inducible protein PhoH
MYNTNNDKEIQVITDSNAVTRGSIKWNDLLERESEKETDINNLKQRLKELNDILGQYNTADKINADKATYNDTDGKVKKQESKIATAEKELAAIRSDKGIMLDKEQQVGIVENIKRDDFYIAVGKIINADGNTLEFIVSCFPAIFFDVIAPLSISVALFLKRRDKKKSKLIEFLENIFIKKVVK